MNNVIATGQFYKPRRGFYILIFSKLTGGDIHFIPVGYHDNSNVWGSGNDFGELITDSKKLRVLKEKTIKGLFEW